MTHFVCEKEREGRVALSHRLSSQEVAVSKSVITGAVLLCSAVEGEACVRNARWRRRRSRPELETFPAF